MRLNFPLQDVKSFSCSSHTTEHIKVVRKRFRSAAKEASQMQGYMAVFARYDIDGSGALECPEFVTGESKQCRPPVELLMRVAYSIAVSDSSSCA
jgi:hypothetical protein